MPEHIFHGGCHGCDNPLSVCPGCQYMLPNWNLPNLNTEDAEESGRMRDPEYASRKNAEREQSKREFQAIMDAHEREHREWVVRAMNAAVAKAKGGMIMEGWRVFCDWQCSPKCPHLFTTKCGSIMCHRYEGASGGSTQLSPSGCSAHRCAGCMEEKRKEDTTRT